MFKHTPRRFNRLLIAICSVLLILLCLSEYKFSIMLRQVQTDKAEAIYMTLMILAGIAILFVLDILRSEYRYPRVDSYMATSIADICDSYPELKEAVAKAQNEGHELNRFDYHVCVDYQQRVLAKDAKCDEEKRLKLAKERISATR